MILSFLLICQRNICLFGVLNPSLSCLKSQLIYLCALHTFGDTFSRATAMPLFKLPALAAQAIWTNCCTGKNKK